MRVVRLGETVNQLADQQVGIQLAPQRAQLAAGAAVQDGLRHAHGPAEAGDDSAHRRDLDVAGSVSHQIDIAARQLAADGNPPGIDGDPGPLESSGLKVMPFQETFQNRPRLRSVFADQTHHALGGRVRNEPVEIGSVRRG